MRNDPVIRAKRYMEKRIFTEMYRNVINEYRTVVPRKPVKKLFKQWMSVLFY